MAIDWDEHVLAPMMSPDVFGESVQPTYYPPGGGSFPVDGVFDNAYTAVVIEADGDPAIAALDPVLGVRLAQFQNHGVLPVKGGKLFVPSVPQTYMVVDVRVDGKGWAKLVLNLTDPVV